MLTEIQPTASRVSPTQIWNQPTAKAQIGDYIRVSCAPVMRVVDRDVLSGGQVRLLVKPTTASGTEEWVLSLEAEQPPAPQPRPQPQPQRQPAGFSGDSVACLMRLAEVAPQQPEAPATETTVVAEFEQGRQHGKHDATARLHPIYTKPVDAYASGYLAGYNSDRPNQHPQAQQPVQWSVTWNQRWGWYDIWLAHRWIGQAATEPEAERMATKRIATDKLIQRQNAAVIKAYAVSSDW